MSAELRSTPPASPSFDIEPPMLSTFDAEYSSDLDPPEQPIVGDRLSALCPLDNAYYDCIMTAKL